MQVLKSLLRDPFCKLNFSQSEIGKGNDFDKLEIMRIYAFNFNFISPFISTSFANNMQHKRKWKQMSNDKKHSYLCYHNQLYESRSFQITLCFCFVCTYSS